MEHNIGELFEDNGVNIRVENSINGCHGCTFLHDTHCANSSTCETCNSLERKDKTNVIFVKVKDNTNNNKDMGKRNIKLDIKTAKEWFNGGDETLKKLALQAYKEEELKGRLPESWEEFYNNKKENEEQYYINNISQIVSIQLKKEYSVACDRNLLPSKKSAEAHLALMQLEQLRDCYREGWEPNWNNDVVRKYVIYNLRNEITEEIGYICSRFLSFQSEELRDKFLDNFKDLIEIAKDYI